MNIVPESKSDFTACTNLALASDQQVLDALPELLEWLQDLNWPVASKVIDRVCTLDKNLDSFILPILRGSDDVWKYWIISGLLTCLHRGLSGSLADELTRIINHPTKSEKEEEVNLVAKELIDSQG
ncbi:MAG: DUF5071 domain-containing protein [Alteromonadales bacterium]|nr:DUF5071 domain-containing protein [Alteromonadales bacterium]